MLNRVAVSFLLSLFFSSMAFAGSLYDGWWFDPDHQGSGMSVEIQDDTMFVAIYTYVPATTEAGLWFTVAAKLDESGFWTGPVLCWENGADSPLPQNPSAKACGGFALTFTSQQEAIMGFALNGILDTTSFKMVKFMPKISPGTPDPALRGWWYDPDYNGMGFFLEDQGGTLFGAWYLYQPDYEGIGKVLTRWTTFSGAYQIGQKSFENDLYIWQGGSTLGAVPYYAPSSKKVEGTRIRLTMLEDGSILCTLSADGVDEYRLHLKRFVF